MGSERASGSAARRKSFFPGGKLWGQIIAFGLVGVLNTGVDFALFSLLRVLFPDTNEVFAQAGGYAAGLVCSFFLNKYVTFKNRTRGIRQATRFLLCNAVTLGVSMGAIYLFHSVLGWQEHLAKLFLVTPLTMALNFFGYKLWVFREAAE